MTNNLIEMDGDASRAIVASLRMYLNFCDQAGNTPKVAHIRDIAYMADKGTQAMYQASQIGADDDN